MKKVLVVSHERSGTHFLINTIANFGYVAGQWIDLPETADPKTLEEFLLRSNKEGMEENRIFKSHHQGHSFRDNALSLLEGWIVFYIVRDGRDVMTSCWNHFNVCFRACFSGVGEMMRADPRNFDFAARYSLTQRENFVSRWAEHVSSWKKHFDARRVTLLKYEDLHREWATQARKIGRLLVAGGVEKLVRPTLVSPGVQPWKGIISNWKAYFEPGDEAYFWEHGAETMEVLGYR